MNKVRFRLALGASSIRFDEFTETELAERYPWIDSNKAFYLRVVQYLDAWKTEMVESSFEFLERE